MKKQKLNYRFHNPNPIDVFAEHLLRILVESNELKVKKLINDKLCLTVSEQNQSEKIKAEAK